MTGHFVEEVDGVFVLRIAGFVCVMKISPEAFTRSSSRAFSSSVPLRRKTTSEKSRGATSSHSRLSSTQAAKSSASRMCSRRIARNPSAP